MADSKLPSSCRFDLLSTVLQADIDAVEIPGAVVVVVQAGHVDYFEAFGFADRASRRPMQKDSIFRIASMTKPITVVAALMLMERGRLLLTDPVARYLPELQTLQVAVEQVDASGRRTITLSPAARPISVHDLMRHTAGFTYGHFGDSLVQRSYRSANLIDSRQTNADMLAKIAQLPLAFQPGTTFEYGMSTDVLGRIVEVVSGMELDRFFADYITGPLAMPDTSFGLPAGQSHRLAEPQRETSVLRTTGAVPYDPAQPTKWFSGGGGLLSTASDYVRFARMLLNRGELEGVRLLSRKSVEWMTQNHLAPGLHYGPRTSDLGSAAPLPALGQGYGLGVGVRQQQGLSPVPGSVGDFYWGGVLGPYFWVDPAEGLVAVFMLQELNVQRRARYRVLLRALVYQGIA